MTAQPSESEKLEDWITTAEAAKILGLTARRVRQLIDEGVIEGRRFASVWMVRRASVERYKNKIRHD